MTRQTATWSVRGANWVWKARASLEKSPMEIATQALESFWNKNTDDLWDKADAWKGEPAFDFRITEGELASLGVILLVTHDKMENPQEQRIQVSAITALANAGFHQDARRLAKSWEDEQRNNV